MLYCKWLPHIAEDRHLTFDVTHFRLEDLYRRMVCRLYKLYRRGVQIAKRSLTLANVFFSHLPCSSGDASTNSFTCLRTFPNVLSSCAGLASSFPSPSPMPMNFT